MKVSAAELRLYIQRRSTEARVKQANVLAPSPDQPAHHGHDPATDEAGTTGESATRNVLQRANDSGDLFVLNQVDRFRNRLPADLQKEYDETLQDLREDDRINFVYEGGAVPSPATEDLVLRHILGSTFGRPDEIDRVLELATDGDSGDGKDNGLDLEDGTFDIIVDGNRDVDPDPARSAGGYAFRDGDIEFSLPTLLNQNDSGRGSVVAHEFAHAKQLGGHPLVNPESNFSEFSILPPDVEQGPRFARFRDLYFDAYSPEEGKYEDTVHYFTRVTEEFFTNPHELQKRSPELYEWFADYQDFDPISGERERGGFLEGILEVFDNAVDVVRKRHESGS